LYYAVNAIIVVLGLGIGSLCINTGAIHGLSSSKKSLFAFAFHPHYILHLNCIMDFFTTIFKSSASEETEVQTDFSYCVIA
jgi:hypothetical protein